MDRELQNLRELVAAAGQGRRRPRFAKPERARIAVWARGEIKRGNDLRVLSEALGLHANTLRKWLADAPAEAAAPGLLPVRVAAERPAARLTLVTPGGYRVEGLSVVQVRELLGALA